jgi:hypothetical protein
METASTWTLVIPGVFRWEIDSPFHGAPLTSHAVVASGRLFIFDPIPLAEPAFSDLASAATPALIVLTNHNHEREAAAWRTRLRAPVWADAGGGLELADPLTLPPGDTVWEGWELFRLPGGGPGEIALYRPELALAVVGDALVNLPGRGLEVLPVQYCEDAANLRRQIRRLASRPFEHLLVAHGAPTVGRAAARILTMLDATTPAGPTSLPSTQT